MLQTACDTIETLKRDIEKPQSRLARSTKRLTWYWKKDDLVKHLVRIERVETWFLLAMTTDRLSSNHEDLLQIQELKLSIEQGQGSQTAEPREVKHEQLLQHLAPIGPETIHSKALSEHQLETSSWFTEGPLQQFLNISDKQGAILRLKGKCSFIAQISYEVPAILEELVAKAEARKSKAQKPKFSAMELEKVFVEHVPAKYLTYLAGSKFPNLRIIISSTSDWSLNTDPSVIRFDALMSSDDVDNDIRVYIDCRLKLDKTLGMLSESLQEEVRNSVLSKSNGMFCYAQCEMDHLASQRTGRGVRRVLSDVPSNLNETYKRTLENIKNTEDRRLIKRALLWLAYSLRPLNLQELADAVVVEEDDDAIDNDIHLHDPMILLEYANGLIEFNLVTQAVSLSHSSIKTFLTSDWIKNSSASYFALGGDTECHLKIMRWCLTYLSYSEFNSGCGVISKSTVSRYPFLDYAAWNWPYHLRNPSAKDWKVVSAFLSTRNSESGGNYGCWIHALDRSIHPETLKETQPLYYAASFGFSPLVEAMLVFDDSLDLEAPGVALALLHYKSLASASRRRAAPEGTYPIKYIQEVQKADAKKRKQIMEGGPTELVDKRLVATEFPRSHVPKAQIDRFLEERFGKGNFVIDVLLMRRFHRTTGDKFEA
ncbi:zinc finger C2H2-like [Fusarium coicis]|nr:zinc finger C2H2-like [Fusarium coicis]